MRDFVLICSTPENRLVVLVAERLHEIEGLGHMDGVDAVREGQGLLQERAVRMGLLASERGIHDDRVRLLGDITDIRQSEIDLGAEALGVHPRYLQRLLGGIESHDHPRIKEPGAYGEHTRAASQVHDLQIGDVPLAIGLEEHVRRDHRRRHILLQGRVRLIERPDLLEYHL